MKTVFVYEHCTAQGLGRNPSDPAHSLYREGKAMRDAVIADFERIEGATVVMLDDDDPAPKGWRARHIMMESAAGVIIAPEMDDELLNICNQCDSTNHNRLGCSTEAIKLASDKLRLAQHWLLNLVPTPATAIANTYANLRYPVVLKRIDGAGSTESYTIQDIGDWFDFSIGLGDSYSQVISRFILQPYIPGRPASVAFLVGTQQTIPLLPCWQHIADDGRFTYLGGEIIEEDALLVRAVKLAQRAIDCVPGLLGYVGVDLILGEAADGSEDYALEINPRLTTSYVGLRAMTEDNLMEIMWALCRGESGFRITWKADRVRFQADGTVERISRR